MSGALHASTCDSASPRALLTPRAGMAGAAPPAAASQAAGSSRKRRSPPPEGESGEFDVRAALASPPGADGAAPPAARLSGATFYTPTAPTPEDAPVAGAAAAPHATHAAAAVAAPQPPPHRTRRHVTFAEAPAPPAALPPPPAARLWSYEDARGRCFGPATAAALAEALRAGDVAPDTLVHAVTADGEDEGASMSLQVVIGLTHSPPRAPTAPVLRRTGSVAAAYARTAVTAAPQQPQAPPLPGGGDPSAASGASEGSLLKWSYRDPSGAVQGPFARSQLTTWLSQRFLPPELRVWRDGAPRGASAPAESEALALEDLVRHGTPPPARAAEVAVPPPPAAAARKAMKQSLKQAVADVAKKALQLRYAAGTLDRERFKECVAATVAKVEKAVRPYARIARLVSAR